MKELKEPPRFKIGTRVAHNGEQWRIVDNVNEYKLMPWNCLQNNGQPIYLPLGTLFPFAFYSYTDDESRSITDI